MDRRRLKQLRRDDGLASELLTIYRDGSGQVPDISRLQIHRPNWVRRVLLSLVLVAGTSLGIYWAVSQLSGNHGNKAATSLAVAVDAPVQLASGEEATYQITYRNADRVAIQSVIVTVRYPDGFTFRQAEPAPVNQYQNTWQIGRLDPGTQGKIRLSGKMIGLVGALKTLAGTATYQPENFSARFPVEFSHTSQITSSILALKIAGPPKIVAGSPVSYTIEYANTADQPFTGILVSLDYPEGFVFKDAAPPPKPLPANLANFSGLGSGEPNGRWYFSTVEAKSTGTITINGGFPAVAGASGAAAPELGVQLGLVDEAGGFSLQQEQRFATQLLRPNLQLSLIVNGNPTGNPVNAGETLNYRLVYKNLGSQALADVSLAVSVVSDLLDWSTLVDKNLGTRDGATLRWNKDTVAALGQLGPLAEGTIDFTLQLKRPEQIDSAVKDFSTVSTARATIGAVDDLESGIEVSSLPLTNSVNTSLSLRAEGRYFDEDNLAVGSGPLPPVVDEKTTFRVYWTLANSFHEATRVTVTTKLSPDAAWEGKFLSSTGQLTYQKDEGLVTWAITSLPAGPPDAEEDGAATTAWFDIAVTPKAGQVGKLLLLTSETNLTATDAVTNATIVGLKRSITTNLEDDPFGGGRGLVVEIGQ